MNTIYQENEKAALIMKIIAFDLDVFEGEEHALSAFLEKKNCVSLSEYYNGLSDAQLHQVALDYFG